MASYFLFPYKDATLYSFYPEQNTGLDSILEIYNQTNFSNFLISSAEVARSLIAFDATEISDVILNKISGSQWQVNLRLFNANTTGININNKIYVYPVSQSWGNGTGKLSDDPSTKNGTSWAWSTFQGGQQWSASSYVAYTTASYKATNPGGGTWYTASISGSLEFTQSFDTLSDKDLNVNVTNIINLWNSGSIVNNGFIIKWGSDIEFNASSSVEPHINYFSGDTHTIYPPQLEFKWNDFTFNTGSNTQGFITSSQMVATLPNNKGFFNQNSIQKFRINVRPQYPVRTFQTSSFYVANKYLPLSSSYAIKDLDTNEFIINFDDTYTKISADSEGSYFTIYMSGLQPERYFSILIKTVVGGETVLLDDNYYFKVVND